MSLGENLKALRKKKGWTQQELAERAGIKLTHISTLEKSDSDPKLSTILKLIEALECSANDLIIAPGATGLSTILKNYLEQAFRLPVADKVLLIKVIEKFLSAESLRIARLTDVPPEILESVLHHDKWVQVAEEEDLRKTAEEEELEEHAKTLAAVEEMKNPM